MVIVALAVFATPAAVSTDSLLAEMADLGRLACPPSPAYKTVQASSYDRASVKPGTDSWFANGDFGQYIRSEAHGGHQEQVLADWKGPGAVVRFWSANPSGNVHFYFDGETEPSFSAPLADLLDGKIEPLHAPFGYTASSGHDLYFPIPFSKSLKVTADGPAGDPGLAHLYYHLDARLYAPETRIRTFDIKRIDPDAEAKAAEGLTAGAPGVAASQPESIGPGRALTVRLSKPEGGCIEAWAVSPQISDTKGDWEDVHRMHNILSRLVVELTFDGQTTVRVPYTDFFGSGIMPAKYESLPAGCDLTGAAWTRFPMPFRHSAVLKVVNHNRFPVTMTSGTSVRSRRMEETYVLHAQWFHDYTRSRPFADMTFVDFKGTGRYVGTELHVQNPNRAWWGEGDEKVWVDDEGFPSWFGTGTEDYFGYAWSDPTHFERPYHAQPRVDGPNNAGQVSNVRWHLFDDIPFTSHIKFQLEKWHWRDVPSRYSAAAFWYAKPGAWRAPEVDSSLLAPIKADPIEMKVADAIEGEDMKVLEKTGGFTEVQGFDGLSNGKQLWWRDAQVGDHLSLALPVQKAGRYRIMANQCFAQDYGIQQIAVNGKVLLTKDFYVDGLTWQMVDWGVMDLPAGQAVVTVTLKGSNPKALKNGMFGIDYILLKKG